MSDLRPFAPRFVENRGDPVRALEELTDDDGTGELLRAWNGTDPGRVRFEGTTLDRF